jgi:hypothetical protein
MTIAPNDFTHLHVHSEISLLDGLGWVNDLATHAQVDRYCYRPRIEGGGRVA